MKRRLNRTKDVKGGAVYHHFRIFLPIYMVRELGWGNLKFLDVRFDGDRIVITRPRK